MAKKSKERPKLKFIDYMMIDGNLVEIDPFKTDLPDRCKRIWMEVMTGGKSEEVVAALKGAKHHEITHRVMA